MAIRQPPSSIKDANLRGFLQELRNAIGKTGNQVNQVAMRVRQITNTPPPPTEPPDPGPPGPPGPPGEPGDGLSPPAPISLTATSDAWAIRLTWEQPADMPADYDVTEIWCRDTNTPGATRHLAGFLRGNSFVFTGLDDHLLSNAETWYFWVRNRDTENLFSSYFPNNDVGVEGKALPSPEDYIDDLIGDITSGTLWNYLGEKIKLLQGPAGIPNSVQARLADQYDDLVQRISEVTVSGNGTIDTIEIWHFDAGTQGWTVTGTGASATMVNGVLVVTAGSTAATVLCSTLTTPFAGSAYHAVRSRLKQVKADPGDPDWDYTLAYKETGSSTIHEYTPNVPAGSLSGFADFDWDLAGENGENWVSSTIERVGFKLAAGQTLHFDWVAVGRIAPGASYSQVEAVRVLSDKKNRVFFQATAPTNPYSDGYALKANDLWFDTDDGNKPYRWNGSAWAETTDTRLAESWAEIYDIRTATANPSGAAAQRINGIAANATSAMATGAANTAAIQAEATARANGDAALSQQINQITAGVNYASRVFIQATAPASDSNYTLKTNDLWYDTSVANTVTLKYWTGSAWAVRRADTKVFYVAYASRPTTGLLVGDLLYDTANNNAPYIWNGSIWVSALEGYINTLADAKITTFEQTKVGYATVTSGFSYNGVDYAIGNLFDNNGQIWTKAQVDTWNAANPTRLLTWNAKLPIAAAIKQVRVSDGQTSATIEQQFIAKKSIDDQLLAQYSVKIDNNGWVSGFGLSSEPAQDGSPRSEFGVRADRFWIAAPSSPGLPTIGVELAPLSAAVGTNAVITVVSGRLTSAAGTAKLYAYFQPSAAHGMAVGEWFTLKNVRASSTTTTTENYHARYNESFKIDGIQGFVYIGNSGAITQNLSVNAGQIPVLFEVPSNFGIGYKTSQSSGPYSDLPKLIQQKYIPFIVTTTTRTIDGVSVPPGVYITDTYIRNATITNAKIADAAITMAKISGSIYSDDFFANGGNVNNPLLTLNAPGWCITRDGKAFFGVVIARTKNIESNGVTASGGYSNTANPPLRRTASQGEFLFWSPSQLAVTYGRGNISFSATLSCFVSAGVGSTKEMVPAIRIYRNGAMVREVLFTTKLLTGPLTMSVNYLDTTKSDAAIIYEFKLVPSVNTAAPDAYVDLNSIDEYWVEYKR